MKTDIHTFAGAYALDALDDVERTAFARHVNECEACSIEVAELRETAARLGGAAWQIPPQRLRENVLAEIRQTRQEPPRGVTGESTRSASRSTWRRRSMFAIAAGVIAVTGGTATWVVADQRVRDEQAQVQALEAERDRISSVLTASDVKVNSRTLSTGGRVTVAAAPSRDSAVVVMADLPAPPTDRVYQLWLMDAAGHAASAGVMEPGQRAGTAVVTGLGQANQVGVTVEPVGGSTTPTSAPLAAVPIV